GVFFCPRGRHAPNGGEADPDGAVGLPAVAVPDDIAERLINRQGDLAAGLVGEGQPTGHRGDHLPSAAEVERVAHHLDLDLGSLWHGHKPGGAPDTDYPVIHFTRWSVFLLAAGPGTTGPNAPRPAAARGPSRHGRSRGSGR